MAAVPEYVNRPRRTALVVDDSRLACAVLSRLLEQEGYDSELAASGPEALERVHEHRPDVIFMDHLMPGMTGLDAVRALKSDACNASIPVVMFSSQEDEEFLAAAREAGALAVLTKHTERANLGKILGQIGQQAATPAVGEPVTARAAAAAAQTPPRVVGLTRADLHAEIGPMLAEQRDRLREELLAELAILENHQESTRRALTGRLEAVLRRTLLEVSEEISSRLAPKPERSFLALFARGGLAAAALALLAVPIGLSVEQGRRLDSLAAGAASLHAAVDSQSRSVAAIGQKVEQLDRRVAATPASLQQAVEAVLRREAAAAPAGAAEPRIAVLPLPELLSAAGIAGPVELRTAQGSFCLELGAGGYRLAPMTPAGRCAAVDAFAIMAGVTPAGRSY